MCNNFVQAKSLLKIRGNVEKTITIMSTNGPIKFQLIKYVIGDDNEIYVLGTTVYDKPIKYFVKYYWKRWTVEIHFRQSKYKLSLSQLKSKTKKALLKIY